MEIVAVYSIRRTIDDALEVDVEFTNSGSLIRIIYFIEPLIPLVLSPIRLVCGLQKMHMKSYPTCQNRH